MAIKRGISGLRGTVAPGEENLSPTVVVQWVQAFAAQLHTLFPDRPFVALGHDARRSSPALVALAQGALLASGIDVLDLGLTLTPTVQFAVRRDARLSGGIMVTASHNPLNWNGLKFLDDQGLFIPPAWWEAMEQHGQAGTLPTVPLEAVGRVELAGEVAWQAHYQAILAELPATMIQARRYRVALDACNGGAARWAEPLRQLGCEVLLLHAEPHGFFAREAEPIPAHLEALRHLVRQAGCDLGLAADPDGDRLVLVDAQGAPVSEEHTVVLAAQALARREGDTVVANVVTTHALEEALPGCRVVRTAVGEMNVVQGILEHGAMLGGEGSGGIIVPKMNLARDGLVAAGLVLSLMAARGSPLHELVAAIPAWQAVKGKLTTHHGSPDGLRPLVAQWSTHPPTLQLTPETLHLEGAQGQLTLRVQPDGVLELQAKGARALEARGEVEGIAPILAHLASQGAALHVALIDGIKVQGEGAWLSLRPSNTEPIIRVMGERRA